MPSFLKVATFHTQHSTLNTQHSTLNTQHSTLNTSYYPNPFLTAHATKPNRLLAPILTKSLSRIWSIWFLFFPMIGFYFFICFICAEQGQIKFIILRKVILAGLFSSPDCGRNNALMRRRKCIIEIISARNNIS